MAEQKAIPQIALTASAYAQADWQRTVNALGSQALEAMGLPTDGSWVVDFSTGLATKQEQDKPALKLEDAAS